MDAVDQLWILFDVFVASVLAGLVGLEREVADKPAGFRTHMIIGGAAALLVSLGKVLTTYYVQDRTLAEVLRIDPIRIIEAIIVGISFLGAGTILKQEKEFKVLYLTTAATILFSAGIGISVALQQYYLAVGLVLMVLLVNLLLRKIFKTNG